MDVLAGDLLVDYRTILAPFAMMSSCATLVWGLQSRYSRVVQSIRTLSDELGNSSEEAGSAALARQLEILRRRAFLLRNGVVGHYLAMAAFLITAVLLALGMNIRFPSALPVVISFFVGLVLVCWTMANSFIDSIRSWDAVGEELRNRAFAVDLVSQDSTRQTFTPFR